MSITLLISEGLCLVLCRFEDTVLIASTCFVFTELQIISWQLCFCFNIQMG